MANLRVDKITSTETFETTGSVQFDGDSDYLETDKAPFQMLHKLTSSWTIESWIYLQNPDDQLTVFDTGGSSNTTIGISLYIDSQIKFRLRQALSSLNASISIDHKLDYQSWHHLSVTFDYDTKIIRIFVDGKIVGSTTYGTESSTDSSKDFKIGAYEYSTNTKDGYLKGHISNMRVLDDKALYTANFKPPMRELEVTPETVLLACQSKTDATHEKTGKTLTANGTAVASELTPGILTPIVKAGGGSAITGSVEFDGNDDYFKVGANSDLSLTGDFTIEYWVYMSKSEPNMRQIGSNNYYVAGKNGNWYFGIHAESTPNVYFFTYDGQSNAESVGVTYTSSLNSWYHLAAVRAGNTLTIYVNGVKLTSGTISKDLVDGADGGLSVGRLPYQNEGFHNGFISNLRIVKGTALYTDNFIPPTRELKKVPGTVLLCCQDPDNPLTEATGKTITPYGDLGDGSLGEELVTNNDVWTLEKGGSGATDWTVSNNGRSLAGTTVTSGYIRATYTVPKGDYLVSLRWTGGNFGVQDSAGYIYATDGSFTDFGSSADGAYSFYMSDTTYVRLNAASWNTAYTVDDISIKRIYKNNGGSNFTPQVGDDRKVTFEGVTKINSDAYFYLPTGDTVTRDSRSGRAVYAGGYGDPGYSNTIEYVNITSAGNGKDFGDLTTHALSMAPTSSSTRGVWMGKELPAPAAPAETIDYVTIASTGNAQDFGDLTTGTRTAGGVSSSTRGIIGGGVTPSITNTIEFITLASLGNATDFSADLTDARRDVAGTQSTTRGLFAGGLAPGISDIIDFVTMATTGSCTDFGDLSAARTSLGALSSHTRAVFGAGGSPNSGSPQNNLDQVTIATLGNATDFGDLYVNRSSGTGTSNKIRGIFVGGLISPSPITASNTIDYITIASTGNAADFGDAIKTDRSKAAVSDSHGGLG